MAFWESKVKIETQILTGEALDEARARAQEAIGAIQAHTNDNLRHLLPSGPTPIVGVPLWRRFLLLYKPVLGTKVDRTLNYMQRASYLLSLAGLLRIIYVVVKATVHMVQAFQHESPKAQAADLAMLAHDKGARGIELLVIVSIVSVAINASVFFWGARREAPRSRPKPLVNI